METTKPGWYEKLSKDTQQLAEDLQLDSAASERLRNFILEAAKEQYKMGNRSGIRWARMNPASERMAQAYKANDEGPSKQDS